ncbi:unnamed protein product [Heligmosomoides polygyrus]|uniref:Secreted protein n=1 Tax=Heligmosomoides polygyrus TaxID=6339 RepID=A0A183GQU4_HELPZ|nr:unnamed protein product [Heligmosomoides polygyrus]
MFYRVASISYTVIIFTLSGAAEELYCRYFLNIVAPSLQRSLAIHKKIAILITDSEDLPDILGLAIS